MSVSAEQFKLYWEVFFERLHDLAKEHLPSDKYNKIQYLHLIPCKITGIVSSEFGVLIKINSADSLTIEAYSCNERIEDKIINFPDEILKAKIKPKIISKSIEFFGFNLKNLFPFILSNKGLYIAFQGCLFSINNIDLETSFYRAEIYGNNDASNWSTDIAKSRAAERILAAVSDLNRAERKGIDLIQYITERKEKNVLLLGNYSDGIKNLNKIKAAISSLGYNPILIKDLPDIPDCDLVGKVRSIGTTCRFVIVEDSFPSGHLVEIEICKNMEWITIIFREENHQSSYMTVDISQKHSNFLETNYNLASPMKEIEDAVNWAEQKLCFLKRNYDESYPWRKS